MSAEVFVHYLNGFMLHGNIFENFLKQDLVGKSVALAAGGRSFESSINFNFLQVTTDP